MRDGRQGFIPSCTTDLFYFLAVASDIVSIGLFWVYWWPRVEHESFSVTASQSAKNHNDIHEIQHDPEIYLLLVISTIGAYIEHMLIQKMGNISTHTVNRFAGSQVYRELQSLTKTDLLLGLFFILLSGEWTVRLYESENTPVILAECITVSAMMRLILLLLKWVAMRVLDPSEDEAAQNNQIGGVALAKFININLAVGVINLLSVIVFGTGMALFADESGLTLPVVQAVLIISGGFFKLAGYARNSIELSGALFFPNRGAQEGATAETPLISAGSLAA